MHLKLKINIFRYDAVHFFRMKTIYWVLTVWGIALYRYSYQGIHFIEKVWQMDLLHKSHNVPVPYPILHHFVTKMCTSLLQKLCIVGYLSNALWDLWDGSIGISFNGYVHTYIKIKHSNHITYFYIYCYMLAAYSLTSHRTHDVIISSKRRHFDMITSKWRRFDVITTSLLRNVSAGFLW